MKSNWFAVAIGRKSIRMQMVWTFIASLAAGMAVATAVPIGLIGFVPSTLVAFFASFTIVFLLLTRRTIGYFLKLSEGLAAISAGNLRFRVTESRRDELGVLAANINAMAEKLESLIQREREIEQSKMELITGVSHDLRTPLTSIIGYLDLLKAKAYQDETEYDRFIGNSFNKAQQLSQLIDELFEYTRLSQGGYKLELSDIDLKEMLNQMLVELQPLARADEMEIVASLPMTPIIVSADSERLRRAIDNLAMNALKFATKPGTIKVALNASGPVAQVTVENEGAAITKAQEERLFDRFYKVDDARTRGGGAGLGLSIARSIAELHGGRVLFAYNSGHYCFRVELPRTSGLSE
ncbi:sensor histidine kinase [Cohnella sp. GCM10020058]|uniref:sensor histidine kinase n=1 Tax=Cohnella sp. GCM10020058 TaxID=3317330 RepID=UPI00362FBB40